jgi:hypothetical protein
MSMAPSATPHRLAMILILAAGVAIQVMLTQLKFSTVRAEWLFRLLFLAAILFDLWAARRRGGALPRALPGALPPVVVAVLFWLSTHDTDAQGAIFIFLLPFVQLTLTGILLVAVPPARRQS